MATHDKQDTEFVLKNLELRKVIKENHAQPITCAAFNNRVEHGEQKRRQHMLATVGSNQLNIYDNANCGSHLDLVCHYLNEKSAYAKGGGLSTLCWLSVPDSSVNEALVAVAGESGEVSVVSVAQSAVVSLLNGHSGHVYWLGTIPKYSWLLLSAGVDGTVRVWDHPNERCLAVLHVGQVSALTVDEHHERLVVIKSKSGAMEFWNLKEFVNKDAPQGVEEALVHRDSKCVSDSGLSYKGIDCMIYIGFACDGPLCALHEKVGRIKIVDLNELKVVSEWTIPAGSNRAKKNSIASSIPGSNKMSISQCGNYLCCGNDQGTVYVHKIGTGGRVSKLEVQRVKGVITNCLFAPECKSILLASDDSLLFRWDYVEPSKSENVEPNQSSNKRNGDEEPADVAKPKRTRT